MRLVLHLNQLNSQWEDSVAYKEEQMLILSVHSISVRIKEQILEEVLRIIMLQLQISSVNSHS